MQRHHGYTLVELLVVISLIAVAMSLLAYGINRAMPGQQLREQTKTVAAELRSTRTRAMVTGQAQLFVLDLAKNRWVSLPASALPQGAWPADLFSTDSEDHGVNDRRDGVIRSSIEVEALTVREESPGDSVAVWRFFADGSSSGGRIIFRIEDAAWRIDIGWLLGDVQVARGAQP